jgi:acetoin utilization protein AcuB
LTASAPELQSPERRACGTVQSREINMTRATKRRASPKPKPAAKGKPASRTKPAAKAKPAATGKLAKPASRAPSVAQFMTATPHTIGHDQTLAYAHELMNKYGIRHLPVLDGGGLVGLLSQRDLYFVESLDSSAAPAQIRVDEAMSNEVSEASVDAPLEEVVRTLVRKKHGCAVITQGAKVVGVFSTIDALKALLKYLQA